MFDYYQRFSNWTFFDSNFTIQAIDERLLHPMLSYLCHLLSFDCSNHPILNLHLFGLLNDDYCLLYWTYLILHHWFSFSTSCFWQSQQFDPNLHPHSTVYPDRVLKMIFMNFSSNFLQHLDLNRFWHELFYSGSRLSTLRWCKLLLKPELKLPLRMKSGHSR